MQTKRLVGIALVLAMLFALTACTPQASSPAAAGTSAPAAATTAPAKDTASAAPPETGPRSKISVAVLDFGRFPSDRGTLEDNDLTAWINENSPVEIEFVPVTRNECTALYTAMLAAGNAPDIISDYSVEAFERFVIDESLMKLDDLIAEHGQNILANVPKEVLDWGVYNGATYAIPRTRDEISVPNWMTWIRQDWLDNLGLSMPTNFDELFEVMRAFTEDDPDGNGEKDTYGWGAGSGESDTGGPGFGGNERIMNLYGGMRDRWLPFGEDGLYDNVEITQNRKQGYAFCEKLFDAGFVNPEFFTMTGQQCRTEFITGKVGTIGMQTSSINATFLNAMLEVDPNANPVPMKTLTSPLGQFAYLQERAAQMHIMIPNSCSDPVAAIKYLDWMVSGAWERIQYGIEGEHFVRVEGRIIPIGDSETRSHDLAEGGVFSIAYGYSKMVSDFELEIDYNKDMSEIDKRVLESRIAATNESMSQDFMWYLPTLHLGLESSNELLPQMVKFATDTYQQAVIDKNVTIDQAYDAIVKEWDALGYQELRKEYNERVKELGY